MSTKLDPREVLEYLNELGYCNITASQLKDFMKDLKKLIKYDEKRANQENIPNNGSNSYKHDLFKKETFSQTKPNLSERSNFTCDTFSNLHSASTVSSRAHAGQSEVFKVSTAKPKRNFVPIPDDVSEKETKIYPSACTFSTATDGFLGASTGSDMEFLKPRAKSSSANGPRPKVSFIRPRKPQYSMKSDPVALYHQYQAEWKKQKLPGEDKHSNLRWSIREKMMGEPSIRPVSVTTSATSSFKRQTNRL